MERVLALKVDHEPLAEAPLPETHDRREAVLGDPPVTHAHVAFDVGDQAHRRLASEVDDLPPVFALVLRRVRIDRRRQRRVVLRGRARVMVHKVVPRRRRMDTRASCIRAPVRVEELLLAARAVQPVWGRSGCSGQLAAPEGDVEVR